MRYPVVILFTSLVLSSPSIFADKPDWAGEGGKPSDSDIEDHREDMQDKNKGKGKKNKNGKDKDKDRDDYEDEIRDRVADEIDDAIRGK